MALQAFDLDPELTEVEFAAWETAHRFARDVMRPAATPCCASQVITLRARASESVWL